MMLTCIHWVICFEAYAHFMIMNNLFSYNADCNILYIMWKIRIAYRDVVIVLLPWLVMMLLENYRVWTSRFSVNSDA